MTLEQVVNIIYSRPPDISVSEALVKLEFCKSRKEAKQKIKEGAVRIDNKKITVDAHIINHERQLIIWHEVDGGINIVSAT